MSYDISLRDPVTGETLHTDKVHALTGGTYAIGGTTELWLNVTYNYYPQFLRAFGEGGIRSIYGLSGAESIPVLEQAISKLGNDVDPDYWEPTDGNAKASLFKLKAMAQMRPDGVWSGD